MALVQIWSPHAPGAPATRVGRRPAIAGGAVTDAALERRAMADGGPADPPPSRDDVFLAFAPYLIIIVVLGVTSISGITKELDKATSAFSWPGLHVLNSKGKAPTSETFKLNYLTAAGTWLLVSGILTAIRPARPADAGGADLRADAGPAQVGDPDRDGGARRSPT